MAVKAWFDEVGNAQDPSAWTPAAPGGADRGDASSLAIASDHGGRGHEIKPEAPDAIVSGKTIAEWTEDWWRWALQAPSDPTLNPLTSSSFKATHFNNDGKIFFIAGGPNARITVPANTPVLFPMINLFDTEGPGIPEAIPGFVESGGSFAAMANEFTDLFQHNIVEAHARITQNGKTLLEVHLPESSEFAEETGTFTTGAPQKNSLLATLNPSPLDPSIADLPFSSSAGDWLMLGKLAPGKYTLEFGGTSAALVDPKTGQQILGGFTTETTDTLIVGHP